MADSGFALEFFEFLIHALLQLDVCLLLLLYFLLVVLLVTLLGLRVSLRKVCRLRLQERKQRLGHRFFLYVTTFDLAPYVVLDLGLSDLSGFKGRNLLVFVDLVLLEHSYVQCLFKHSEDAFGGDITLEVLPKALGFARPFGVFVLFALHAAVLAPATRFELLA